MGPVRVGAAKHAESVLKYRERGGCCFFFREAMSASLKTKCALAMLSIRRPLKRPDPSSKPSVATNSEEWPPGSAMGEPVDTQSLLFLIISNTQQEEGRT